MAQLVARLTGSQKVTSSNLVISTKETQIGTTRFESSFTAKLLTVATAKCIIILQNTLRVYARRRSMILNLMAVAEEAEEASGGMPIGVLVGLIIGGVVLLSFIVLGIVLKAIEQVRKSKRAKAKRVQEQPVVVEEPAPVVVEEKFYDYTNLSEEEKALIRQYRDQTK